MRFLFASLLGLAFSLVLGGALRASHASAHLPPGPCAPSDASITLRTASELPGTQHDSSGTDDDTGDDFGDDLSDDSQDELLDQVASVLTHVRTPGADTTVWSTPALRPARLPVGRWRDGPEAPPPRS